MKVGKLQSLLDGAGESPNEQVLKSRLREMDLPDAVSCARRPDR